MTVTAHGLQTGTTKCASWREVQQHCRRIEREMEESFDERHAACGDESGTSGNACTFCERG